MKVSSVTTILAIAFLSCVVDSRHAAAPVALQKRAVGDIITNICGTAVNLSGFLGTTVSTLIDTVLKSVLSLIGVIVDLIGDPNILVCVQELVETTVLGRVKKCVDDTLASLATNVAELCKMVNNSLGPILNCVTGLLVNPQCVVGALVGVTMTVGEVVRTLVPLLLAILGPVLNCSLDFVADVIANIISEILGKLLTCIRL